MEFKDGDEVKGSGKVKGKDAGGKKKADVEGEPKGYKYFSFKK